MAQQGYVFKKNGSWYLRYRDNFLVDGKIIRKQKCVQLAEVGDKYRRPSDLKDLVKEKLDAVGAADKCPKSSQGFVTYVEDVYFAFARQALKPSTVAGYTNYWKRYIRPRVENYSLRDFVTAIIASLLKDISRAHNLNTDTVSKIRSVLCAIFSYAISEGHFPARSASDNPARGARIPVELTSEPKETAVATREQVQALLKAFENLPLERAAIGLMALGGLRPNEARGLDWQDWDRSQQHLAIRRGAWHSHIGTTKTEQSQAFVTVTNELREILLNLWHAKGCPISGFVLAGTRKDKNGKTKPVILDNVSKRTIADTLNRCSVCHEPESAEHKSHTFKQDESLATWPGWYSLRRFHATQVCVQADSETAANALRNTKEVAKSHYIKPTSVLPDVRKAVNNAFSGLLQ